MQQIAPTALEVYEALRAAGVKGITYEGETGGGNTLVAAYLPWHHVVYANTLYPSIGRYYVGDDGADYEYVKPVEGRHWDGNVMPTINEVVTLFIQYKDKAEEVAYDEGDNGRHHATEQELALAVADAIREVESDMADGTVPRSVRSFGELHDYVDANEYGGLCDDDNPRSWWSTWSANRLQGAIDQMLANGDFDH